MSVLLAILGIVGAIALLVVRSLAVDEIKGRLQRRITASVEATIAALPEELQAEWADEWRADLAAVISMPFTAAQFARGVRTSAHQLIASQAPAPADIIDPRPSQIARVRDAVRIAGAWLVLTVTLNAINFGLGHIFAPLIAPLFEYSGVVGWSAWLAATGLSFWLAWHASLALLKGAHAALARVKGDREDRSRSKRVQ